MTRFIGSLLLVLECMITIIPQIPNLTLCKVPIECLQCFFFQNLAICLLVHILVELDLHFHQISWLSLISVSLDWK